MQWDWFFRLEAIDVKNSVYLAGSTREKLIMQRVDPRFDILREAEEALDCITMMGTTGVIQRQMADRFIRDMVNIFVVVVSGTSLRFFFSPL